MSKKISELEDGEEFQPGDLIPIARGSDNFHISANNVLSRRRFTMLTNTNSQTIQPYTYHVFQLNTKIGGENWYNLSAEPIGQRFQPGEIGYYKVDGCFTFNLENTGTFRLDILKENPNNSLENLNYRHETIFVPNHDYGCLKYVFADILHISDPQDSFVIKIARSAEPIIINAGTDNYNKWFVIFEKLEIPE